MENIIELTQDTLTRLHNTEGISYSKMRTVYEDLLHHEMWDLNYLPKQSEDASVLRTITKLRQMQVPKEIIYLTIRKLLSNEREEQKLERKVNYNG